MPLANIERAFEQRPALMPYFPLGYPDLETSLRVVEAIARSGADLIELGLPFSDPIADGPVIQHATQTALRNGMTVARGLEMAAELRRRGVRTPFLLMSYVNPLIAYPTPLRSGDYRGLSRVVADAAVAGMDGFIVPDLPIEESDELDALCAENDLALIYFLAPTSTAERIERVARRARGFIYAVSVTGITGARDQLPAGVTDFIRRIKMATDCPLAVGFGISTPEQAKQIGRVADGVIVGSALVKAAGQGDPVASAGAFVRSLREGMGQLSLASMHGS
jgi:tryptophan synthase alpha chain